MSEGFALHQRLAQDSELVCVLDLSQLRLSKDANYPWLILIPQRADVVELFNLSVSDQALLLTEINQVSLALQNLFTPDKLNVAALGNMVPQLHIHLIARFKDDVAWPNPVWGFVPALAYSASQLQARIQAVRTALHRNE